jgi:hypothetical protein
MPDTLHTACQTEKPHQFSVICPQIQFLPQAECEVLGIFTMFWGRVILAMPRPADFARTGPRKPL